MPSIGSATAVILARRIDEAIGANFDEGTREDAYRFLNLSLRGGDTTYLTLVIVFGVLMTIVISLNGLANGVAAGTVSMLALYWTVWRRKKARRELDALAASNREYWLPIAEKLKQIVLNAGKFEDLWPPSQVTRIKH